MSFNKLKAIASLSVILALSACSQVKKDGSSEGSISKTKDIKNEYEYHNISEADISYNSNHLLTENGYAHIDSVNDPDKLYVLDNNIINFEFDSSLLTKNMKELVNPHISFLMRNQNIKVILEGHTDERGSDSYNLVLGEKRANAVKQYMVDNGIQIDQIEVVSFGELMPINNESNESAWSNNRRSVFKYK